MCFPFPEKASAAAFRAQLSDEAPDKIASMNNYYNLRDWHNYEIFVHALKSTSKMIGIGDLSEKAKALEQAAKETGEEFILGHHEEMIKDYSRITADIKEQLLSEEDSLDDDVFEFSPESEGGDKA